MRRRVPYVEVKLTESMVLPLVRILAATAAKIPA
jgi:hypothetical protein